jgi:hypothetical protein
MKGYKYVAWDIDDYNSKIYLNKERNKSPVHYSDLKKTKGYYDKDNVSGIHFCLTQEELCSWVRDCFEWEDPSCIEILEITPITEITVRHYADGRKAYIADSCFVRVLKDDEFEESLLNIITKHFG